jgi:tetratricopeptide (TPR) repeat protein
VDPIWQQINEAIHRRDTETVDRLIPKYLKSHQSSAESLYEASEFYRKITDYKSAIRILPKERGAGPGISEAETKLELQLARLLNILGASNYALRMIERIRAENRAKSKVEMAEIYFCNYKFEELLELLGPDYPLPESEPWHQDWLLHFYLAIAFGELKRMDLAIARVEGIRALSSSPLIRAMTLSYQGKFLLMGGEPAKALPLLLESQRFFQDQDRTADHAILQGHLGECFLRLGKFFKAEKALERSSKIFCQPAVKPEEWIEIELLLDRIPGYRKSDQRLTPRLSAMYGSEYPPLKIADQDELESKNLIFSASKIETERKRYHIDRKSETSWVGQKAHLGLDLIDGLICNLIYAGEYGLPQFRIYELLWPNEPFSFSQHQKRLEDVVGRARARGYKISWKDLHLSLLSKDVSASDRPERVIRGYSFLVEHTAFTMREVESYYSISNTTARVLCRDWLKAKLVVSENRAQYRVLIS